MFFCVLVLCELLHISHMVLLKYFNCVNVSSETVLPNPESSLNGVVNWIV